MTMLQSALSWLDDYVAEHGTIGVASSALGILAFGGTMAMVFGDTALRLAAVLVVLLLTASLISALVANQIKMTHESRRTQRLLTLYTQMFEDAFGREYRVLSWHNFVEMTKNGDVTETISATLQVESDGLRYLRFHNGAGWPQSQRHRRRVRVEVNTVELDNGRPGTSWDVTTAWLADGKLDVLAHCYFPTVRGAKVSVRLTYHWPRKNLPLMRGQREHFWLSFRQGAELVTYTLVFPDDREVRYEHFNPALPGAELKRSLDFSGRRTQIELIARDVPPKAQVGVWLQSAGRG
jgi:hypothetical protein